jgi:hypothetical protein
MISLEERKFLEKAVENERLRIIECELQLKEL